MKRSLMSWLCAGLLSGTIAAQTTGTISGTVSDRSGAVLAGATVELQNAATLEARTATTNGAGKYAFPSVAPGNYDLRFSYKGFANVLQHLTLHVTDRLAVDAELQPAGIVQTVEVTAQAVALQRDTPALSKVVDGSDITQLPLSTRNFTQLLALSPGTSAPLNNAGALGRATQNISTNGARTGSNAIYIDGVDAVNLHSNSANGNAFASNGIVTPSPEAIAEFKVQTALYDAQSGRSGGANVALVTKTGTEHFHGSVFEFFRNDVLNANSFFLNATGQPRPELRQNQFGGVIGGPIVGKKTFFFFSYQGTRQVNGLSGSTSLTLPAIPTDRSRAAIGSAFAGQAGAKGGAVKIAANGSNINPVAFALLNLKFGDGSYVIPSPQISATSGVNYATSRPATFNEDQYIGNLDHQITSKNLLSFKSVNAEQPTFQSFPSATLPGFGTNQLFSSRLFAVQDVHIFTPSLVNEGRAGFSRLVGSMAHQNSFPISAIGMSRFNSAIFSDIPMITVTRTFSLGYSVNSDQDVALNTFNVSDSLSWTHGKHQVHGGMEGRRYYDNYFSNNRMRGTVTFQSFPDFLLGLSGAPVAQGGNGTGFSNINSTSIASGVVTRNDRLTDLAFFLQDVWSVTPRLTLNAGLRWEYLGWPVDAGGRNGAFDPRRYQPPPPGGSTTAGFVQASNARPPIPGITLVNPTLIDRSPTRNFAPRIGFSLQASNTLVVRGGYGIFYDRLSNQLGLLEALSLPNYVRSDASGAANIASTFANPFPVLPLPSQFPVVPTLYAPPFTAAHPALAINDVDASFTTPYIQQWSLNLQEQPAKSTIVEVGYVGTKGTHLPVEQLINQAILAGPANPVNGLTTNLASNAAQRVPYLGFSPAGIIYLRSASDSSYHSLQASVVHQASRGLKMQAAYTFSKSMDDASGSLDAAVFNGFDGDQSNIHGNRGISDFDRKHRFTTSFDYALPNWGFGLRDSRFGKKFFGGWEIAGVAVFQSGLPFSVLDGNGAAYYGVTTSRANFAPGATAGSVAKSGPTEGRLQAYFNTSAFAGAGNFFGTSGRNLLRGPGQRNIDFSVIKSVPLTERVHLEWRVEFFNVFNFVNFDNPANDISSKSFGAIQGTVGNPRVIQFAAKLGF